MSHELRTPLNGILGYAQLMKRDPRLTESHKEGANIIQRSGEHLLELINDVLDLSKIEARRMELRETEVRLQQMLTGIVDLFTIRAEQKGLRFRFESSNAHPVGIWADEQKIRQVLINLLGNAVKFTRSGEVRLVVTALETVSAERITLRFCVEDTGIGIDATQLETIFQPFSRIEQKDSTSEGTGLGLSISHEFVRMMDSDLKVKSRPEEGTAFWFDITCPLVACPDSPETMVHQGPVTGYAGPPKSILVVDDAADNRRVIVDALHPLGFKMYEAENGAEGLRIAREKVPDLMLVDLIMPDQDGFETVRQVKQASELKLMAILALSASVSDESRRDSLEAGCDDFIPKPVVFDTLMDAIRKALDLVWQSDGEEAPSLSTAEATTSSPTQPMIMPPLTDIETLHKLAVVGDIQHLLRALDRIASEPTYHTFTDTIRGLTKTYDLKQIRTLLEAHV